MKRKMLDIFISIRLGLIQTEIKFAHEQEKKFVVIHVVGLNEHFSFEKK